MKYLEAVESLKEIFREFPELEYVERIDPTTIPFAGPESINLEILLRTTRSQEVCVREEGEKVMDGFIVFLVGSLMAAFGIALLSLGIKLLLSSLQEIIYVRKNTKVPNEPSV